ncbi:type III effector protein [Roseateles sp. 22389]|uniref:type III effector protein n=1 Tax=Roseateles sp. 22389 TaxID=3453916 RepID=UPI003F87597A
MSMSKIQSPSQSPAPLVTGSTSSNPTTPLEPPRQEELQQPQGLRRRVRSGLESAGDAASQLAGRISLPQVAEAAVNTSLTHTTGSKIKDAVMPTLSTVGAVIKTGVKAVKQFSQSAVSSQPLQNALRAELDPAKLAPEDREQAGANQLKAHQEAIKYGQGSAQWMDRLQPLATSILRVGLAGTSMAFGVGRNAGLAAGDAVARAEQGRPQSGAVFDNSAAAPGAAPSGPPSLKSMVVSTVTQLFMGSTAGATGNLLGQTVVAPVINLMPRQFAPIDDKAVVPDQVVKDMNTLLPGSGDQLRASVKAQQAEITNISSDSNVTLGQIAFDAVTAARAAALGPTPLGVAGQVGFGLGVSATAGGVIGAVMGVRQSVATVKVPDAAQLSELVASGRTDGAQALQDLMKKGNEVPLFFAKHMNATVPSTSTPSTSTAGGDIESGGPATTQAPPLSTAAKAGQVVSAVASVVTTPLNAIGAAFKAGPLMDPQPTVEGAPPRSTLSVAGHTLSNIGASVLNRAGEMVKATTALGLISTVTAAVARPLAQADQRVAMAIGGAIGIHTAIKPWFDSSAKDIPAGDAKIKTNRLEVVNAQAQDQLAAAQR